MKCDRCKRRDTEVFISKAGQYSRYSWLCAACSSAEWREAEAANASA